MMGRGVSGARLPFLCAVVLVGLGSGVSLGPEGPSVEIGVDLATIFIEQFKSGRQHIASLIAAGSGAGVAAGFNAPISGVFFAVESVLQRESGAWLSDWRVD